MASVTADEDTTPGFPFDNPDADIILRSSDNVDFRMYKLDLRRCSPFFAAMFTLPQPLSSAEQSEDGIPVIPMSESAVLLRILLRFFNSAELVKGVRRILICKR